MKGWQDHRSRVGAIIVASGGSSRMGGVDKIFAPLAGKPLLAHTIEVFQNCASIDGIVLVLARERVRVGEELAREHHWSKVKEICPGGPRRQDSVAEGLKRLFSCQWVVIHDGARPCLDVSLIERGLKEAKETGAAVAAVPLSDTVKVVESEGLVRETLCRENLWAVQTPQVFRFDIISEAYRNMVGEATDDATLVERLGYQVRVYTGSYFNIKVTAPEDLALARFLLESRQEASKAGPF